MFKVNISNSSQNLSWSGSFLTEIEAQAWLSQQIGKPHRLPERDVPTYDENGQPILDENGDSVLETLPAEFTSEIIDITAAHNDAENKRLKIVEGAKARQACQSVLDLVAGYNLDNDLTAEQITSMQTTFSTIFQLLLANRPSSAKALINAIDPDGVIVTTQMKQDCLDLLANY